jgi:hypothetical protein
MTPDIDALIEECITNLSDDNIKMGGESLQELARYWAKAGLTLKSFMDMRTYIINAAIEKTDAFFIREKLKLAEEDLRVKRTGSIIIH